ncbi:MAG: MarR family transcriptional regulator [Paenibacillaceae bacterium]|jgi:MarR family 2-MHQ and catechol resistance regulon transcriptional repressor|nr:MarR family transcriptional regulator [Paenibacillaceae bacterium]
MPYETDPDRAASLKLFVVLSKAYNRIASQAIKDMKRHGLSPSEFTIMELLYHKGRIPLQQIGERILITSGSITYNIDKLEQKALLKRVPCAEDRRVIYAEITPDGSGLMERVFPLHAEVLHSAMAGLSSEEKASAALLLKKLGKGGINH